jgi:hypothetical protein
MITVISRPYDDKTIVDVYMAEHESKGQQEFEEDWDVTLGAAKLARPETWTIEQVIARMEKRGWQILRTNPVIVTY